MMHGLILAGGEGSRLAADGVTAPKALVTVGGRPQLVGLAERFAALGCASVTCLVHADVAAGVQSFAVPRGVPVRVVPCRTPSSLHTLVAGFAAVPPGAVFCSMVDTVMAPADWTRVYESCATALAGANARSSGADGGVAGARHPDTGARAADAVLALTPDPGGDDAPLRVRLADGVSAPEAGGVAARVGQIGGAVETHGGGPPLITGGVYAFAPAARARAEALAAAGGARMRVFLADLVDGGADVRAVVVPRILDVDHRRDLDAANAYAAEWAEP